MVKGETTTYTNQDLAKVLNVFEGRVEGVVKVGTTGPIRTTILAELSGDVLYITTDIGVLAGLASTTIFKENDEEIYISADGDETLRIRGFYLYFTPLN